MELGRQELTQLPAGQYSTVSFPLTSTLVAALSENYTDLQIKLVINAPALSAPYVFDNLVMTDDSQPDPDPGQGDEVTFSIVLPAGRAAEDTLLSATNHLSLFAQAHAGEIGATPAIANFGSFTTYLQAEAHAYADIYSTGPVQLDSQTHVGGSITTASTIGKQGEGTGDEPVVEGDELPNTPVESELLSWDVQWPQTPGQDVKLDAAPTEEPVLTPLSPGNYRAFDVKSRNHVFLSTGTYFFDTFNTEPEAELHLDTSDGPVIVYVRQNLPWGTGIGSKAPVFTDTGDEAQLLLAFAGTSDVFVQGSFQGTLVAPNALIKLERPSNPGLPEPAPDHRGAFFGRSVEVASGQHTVLHVPLAGDFPPRPPVPFNGESGRRFSSKVGPLEPYFVGAPFSFFSLNFDDPDGNVPPLSALIGGSGTVQPSAFAAGILTFRSKWVTLDPGGNGASLNDHLWEMHVLIDGKDTGGLTGLGNFACGSVGAGAPPCVTGRTYGYPDPDDIADCPRDDTPDDDAGRVCLGLEQLQQRIFWERTGIVDLDEDSSIISVELNLLGSFSGINDIVFDLEVDLDTNTVTPVPGSALPIGVVEQVTPECVDFTEQGLLWRFCWETEVDASPPPPPPPAQNAGRLCVEWNTNYVDEGFGETVTAPYRAAHAEYFLYLDSPSLTAPLILGANPDPTGGLPPGSPAFLDEDGCVPQADLDPNLLVHQPGPQPSTSSSRCVSARSSRIRTAAPSITSAATATPSLPTTSPTPTWHPLATSCSASATSRIACGKPTAGKPKAAGSSRPRPPCCKTPPCTA